MHKLTICAKLLTHIYIDFGKCIAKVMTGNIECNKNVNACNIYYFVFWEFVLSKQKNRILKHIYANYN